MTTDLNNFTGFVKFSAIWCGPCRAFAPLVEEITDELNIPLVEVDIDDESELASEWKIRSIPFLISFQDGEPLGSFSGAVSKKELEEFAAKSGFKETEKE